MSDHILCVPDWLQLRSYLTEILHDQLPVMADFHRYLEQLAIMEAPPAQNSLIIEQVQGDVVLLYVKCCVRSRDMGIRFLLYLGYAAA